jgi:hypothetical protein
MVPRCARITARRTAFDPVLRESLVVGQIGRFHTALFASDKPGKTAFDT